MPKPTIIFALDPYSAVFCAAIQKQLERYSPIQASLLQVHTLTWDGINFDFNSKLQSMPTEKSDREKISSQLNSVNQIRKQFKQATSKLQSLLIELLTASYNSPEINAAKRAGIDISNQHRIYFMLSAKEQISRGVFFELSRLLRWLFSKFFVDIPHSLEAILLLPDLFSPANNSDYSAAYGFLKELDFTMTNQQKGLLFDNCWLIDGQSGGLKDNLSNYADAFVGFLNFEPDTAGVLIGTNKVRGKISAYSSFGYGELIFPVEIAITRLSSALAADIMKQQFLPQQESTPETNRKLLLDAKEFILSDDFSDAFLQLERDNGKPVWQDFNPRIDMRPGMAQEYGKELQRAYRQFQNQQLLTYKRTLENCSKEVQTILTSFLDSRISNYADTTSSGLNESVKLLQILTYSYLELQTDAISEQPQNLITELRSIEGFLDSRLEVTINREKTQNLLNQILSLRGKRQQLQESLAELNSSELLEELQTTQKQLENTISEYRQAVNTEIEQARQIRITAVERARDQVKQNIDSVEKQLNFLEKEIETATDKLDQILTKETEFRNKYLIVYPTLVLLILVGLVVLLGIFSQSILWLLLKHFWGNLVNYLLWIFIAVLTYLGTIWIKYSSTIREPIQQIKKRIKSLESSLKANAVELRRSYNEQLKLEYDLYAQNLRLETLNYLIKTAKQYGEKLRQTISNFSQIHNDLLTQREQANTYFSDIRLTVLTNKDIDDYYVLSNLPTNKFTQEQISRSQSWQISAAEFQNQLISFARQEFDNLSNLSIGELLKQADIIPENTRTQRLNQLYDSSKLLVRLQDIETNLNSASQKEINLWVGAKDKEEMISFYSRFHRSLTTLVVEDEQRLCLLTRHLGFPAYFLSQIEFYRHCYEQSQSEKIENEDHIPDLVPEEIGANRELEEAYKTLLLSLSLDILAKNSQGHYHLQTQLKTQLLGKDRKQIALALATEFTLQEIYDQLQDDIERFEPDMIYEKVEEFTASAPDLTTYERKLLDKLLLKYNPLN
ncbi:hypothetical protein FJR11_17665 [Anabaena sp. UHCC 0187]|uniref:hypothetical protein n=1 Tax=Anabaena sp. UHCC 0187 TaxID=2590018 RepID=UPI001446CE8A|nr:hypothetical protein [Anabaena sp. UHCC 0187]MTJ14373.1 hypothetical protein [Anabaena sp. UHCC 0187]